MSGASFVTDEELVVPAVSAQTMREVDRIAVEEQSPNLFQMMENAGRSAALAAIDHLGPGWRDIPIAVLAGRGGNGAGGICAARHLSNHGGDVVVVITEPARLSPVAEQQLGVYRKTTGRIEPIGSFEPGLILDAVIGYGLEGAPRRPAEEAIGWMKGRTAPVISLDVPSGLDATTGESTGESVEAAITVTLALPKTGLLAGAAGEIWLADLGIPHEIYAIAGIEVPQPLFDHGYLMRLHRRGL